MGVENFFGDNIIFTRVNDAVNWGRKYSFFLYPKGCQ